jgi:hypothetical protein
MGTRSKLPDLVIGIVALAIATGARAAEPSPGSGEGSAAPTRTAAAGSTIEALIDDSAQMIHVWQALSRTAGLSKPTQELVNQEYQRRLDALERLRFDYTRGYIERDVAFTRAMSQFDVWPTIEQLIGREEFIKIARASTAIDRYPGSDSNFLMQRLRVLCCFYRIKPSPSQQRLFARLMLQAMDNFATIETSIRPGEQPLDRAAGMQKVMRELNDGIELVLTQTQFSKFQTQVADERRRWSIEDSGNVIATVDTR